jgi:GntR family transcriptional regulator
MSGSGYEIVNQVQSFRVVEADPHQARRLQLQERAPLVEISRVRLLNREPVSLERTWIPERIGRRLASADLATRDIFLILENDCDIPLGHADITLDAILADAEIGAALGVEHGSPVLRIERLTHDSASRPIDYEFLYFRGDAFQYRLRIDRETSALNTRTQS